MMLAISAIYLMTINSERRVGRKRREAATAIENLVRHHEVLLLLFKVKKRFT